MCSFARSSVPARTVRPATRAKLALSRTAGALAFGIIAVLADSHAAAAAPACAQYPIPWQPPAGSQAAARSELASVSPAASMAWNASTGTLSSALALALPLAGCTDGQDVGAQVFAALAAHPALFQLDLSEWRTPAPYDCKYVGDNEILSIGRQRLAGHPVSRDVFAYSLKRVDGAIQLTAVTGTYVPVIDAAIGDAMAACNTLTTDAAQATARSTPLQTTVYSQCKRTRTMTYTPQANDHFELAPQETWTWQEGTSQMGATLFTGERTLRITVDPANYTPDLMSSAARCPAPDGDDDEFTIGFDVAFDVHTGAIVNVKPGLDCVVC